MDFEVKRADLATTRVVGLGPLALGPEQVLLRVDAFSLTANNITYGVFGDAMRYWDFFPPSSADGWGRIPAFGFADVAESNHPDVEVGLRVFGYFPMSTELVVSPQRVDERGFFDGADHRRAMASTYNHYLRVDADASYVVAREPHQMLLRPLFFTSYLAEDLLADNDRFGADTVLLSSASSKTALGTAFLLAARERVEVVGLTSHRNRAFVEGLDVYHRVATYDEVASLPVSPSVYVDLSGSGPLREAVHAHLGAELAYDMVIGATHWEDGGGGGALSGPSPTMFFAPSQVAKRTQEWGRDTFDERLGDAWSRYVDWADGWLDVRRDAGPDAVTAAYGEVLRGETEPAIGHVLSLHPPA